MSVPMEWDEPTMEAVPLDLTVKKEDNHPVSEGGAERDGPGKSTEDAPLPQNSDQNGVESMPLDLSVRRALPLQPSPPPTSANVAQRATVVAPSPKVQVESSPPPSPQPQFKGYWPPASPSPMTAAEHLAPLHGMYNEAAAYRHLVLSSAAVSEYNPFTPVLPTSTANHYHQNNQIEHQLQYLHMQQQNLLNLQNQLHIQQQFQLQLHQLNKQQKLQLQAAYGDVPLETASMLSGSPVYSSVSNHFPSPNANDHRQQQQQQRDLEHRHHIDACMADDTDVVDPEDVAAIYRQTEFLSFRHRYIDSLGPRRNIDKMRRPSNNNNNNSSSGKSSDNNDNHGLTAGQQQNDQTYAMKRKKNEASRRSWEAKRQKYFENQISVMYLTKKVSEMKEIKRRLLNVNSNILGE